MTPEILTEKQMTYLWDEIDKIHPAAFDGWFGMGVEQWIEFGVLLHDTPEEAYNKVTTGIEQKLIEKDPNWYVETGN